MTATTKNWLTSTLGPAGLALLVYLTTNVPAGDTWALWRPVLFAGIGAFFLSVYHAYQPASGANAAAKAAAVKVVGSLLMLVAVISLSGCLSSAPLVPVTSVNQAQVTACQNTATLHNGVVIGDFALSAGAAGVASGAILATDSGTKNTLSGVGIGLAGGLAIGTAIAELTASNFQNSQCAAVVGPLPTAPAPKGQ